MWGRGRISPTETALLSFSVIPRREEPHCRLVTQNSRQPEETSLSLSRGLILLDLHHTGAVVQAGALGNGNQDGVPHKEAGQQPPCGGDPVRMWDSRVGIFKKDALVKGILLLPFFKRFF